MSLVLGFSLYTIQVMLSGREPTPRRYFALDRLKAAGNSLFVDEQELDVIHHAGWIVKVGTATGRTAVGSSTAFVGQSRISLEDIQR
ncbi:MAG: hypothetical protein U0791_19420, partial [Gemmataceae bacterium]